MKRKLKLNTYSTKDGSFVGGTEIEVDEPLPLVLPYPKDFPKPPWTDQERVRDWTVTQLEAMDKAITDGPPTHPRSFWQFADDPEERAIAEADGGSIEPLRKLYPQFARFLNLPKLKRGQHFKPLITDDLPVSQWDLPARIRAASLEVRRIRALWKAAYDRKNRWEGDNIAIEIAAKRWKVSENDVRKGIPRKKG